MLACKIPAAESRPKNHGFEEASSAPAQETQKVWRETRGSQEKGPGRGEKPPQGDHPGFLVLLVTFDIAF